MLRVVMSPLPPLITVAGLADRWGIDRTAVHYWLKQDGFPLEGQADEGLRDKVWSKADIDAWEEARRTAGLPLPGERPRGREPKGGR